MRRVVLLAFVVFLTVASVEAADPNVRVNQPRDRSVVQLESVMTIKFGLTPDPMPDPECEIQMKLYYSGSVMVSWIWVLEQEPVDHPPGSVNYGFRSYSKHTEPEYDIELRSNVLYQRTFPPDFTFRGTIVVPDVGFYGLEATALGVGCGPAEPDSHMAVFWASEE